MTWKSYLLVAVFLAMLPAMASADEHLTSDESETEVVPDESAGGRAGQRAQNLGSEGDDLHEEEAPIQEEIATIGLAFYGSGRVRATASDGKLRLSDNRSRLGIYGYKFVTPRTEIFSRIELGTDLGGDLDGLLLPPENPRDESDGTIFLRVGLVGVGTRFGDFSVGKQWSTYYDVSGYTDRFAVFGARGTSTYNAGTDGGGSGTGRADRAVKYQSHGAKLSIGLQAQDDGNIPLTENRKYDAGVGASLNYDWNSQWSIGVAYNRSFIDNLDQDLIDLGLTGDAWAAVIGLKYSTEALNLATTFARHENHEANNEEKYIDADGWELYGRYKFSDRLRAVGGVNYLEPDKDDPQAGKYDVRSVIIGLQYSYGDVSFGDMIYFEAEMRNGKNADGSNKENAYTVGIRYSFKL